MALTFNQDLQRSQRSGELSNQLTKEAYSQKTNQDLNIWKQKMDYLKAGSAGYLETWAKSLDDAGGIYNNALGTLNDALKETGSMKLAADKLDALAAEMGQDFDSYIESFNPMQEAAVGEFNETMADRKRLRGAYMDLVPGDTEEAVGLAGTRAMTDVGLQGENARQAMAREDVSLGIDPTSGSSRFARNRQRNDEVLSKANVGNLARRLESDRLSKIVSDGLQLINPYESSTAAGAMQAQKVGMRSQQAGVLANAANARGNVVQSIGNIGAGEAAIGARKAGLGSEYGKIAKFNADVAGMG